MSEAASDIPPVEPSPEESSGDTPPKRGILSFPKPSGRTWKKDENDTPPKPPKQPKEPKSRRDETPAKRKARIEKSLGRTYVGVAAMIGQIDRYDQAVLMWQCEEFVDSTMEMAEEHPRILDWLDGATTIGVYGKFFGVVSAMAICIGANHGFMPEWIVEHIEGAPPLPEIKD